MGLHPRIYREAIVNAERGEWRAQNPAAAPFGPVRASAESEQVESEQVQSQSKCQEPFLSGKRFLAPSPPVSTAIRQKAVMTILRSGSFAVD
jgi:hypothetical protein